jgi:RNA polymerase sigma-70 factor (ECF subfamily)
MGVLRRLSIRRDSGEQTAPADSSPPPQLDEHELIERARAGERDAWTRLYHEHFARLYHFVGHLTGDPCIAEDLTQEVFARAYVGLSRFNGRSKLFTWLCGIATNVVRKHWRYQRRHGGRGVIAAEPSTLPPSSRERADPEHRQEQRQRAAALRAALQTLPDHYREAFVLVAIRDLSPTEASLTLGISPGNVSVRVHRARARLRKQLATMGWSSGGTQT